MFNNEWNDDDYSNSLSDEQNRWNWSVDQYMDWLDPQIEELLENQESKRDQRIISELTYNFGYFLFHKWYQMTYQSLGRNGKLEFWKWWADWYQIDSSEFDDIWEFIFV